MFSYEFLLTSLVVVLIPGTGVIYTVSNGLLLGRRAGVAAAAGCTLGIVPHLLAGMLGLSAVLHVSALAFQVVKYAGAAYLLYLAWAMWRETGTFGIQEAGGRSGATQIIVRGLLINILNPKLSIFFLAFLPQFISVEAGHTLMQMGRLSLVFMLMTLVIFIGYGICAHGVRTWLIHSPRRMRRLQRSFALAFAVLGVKLAMSEQ